MAREVQEFQAKVTADTSSAAKDISALDKQATDLTKKPYDIDLRVKPGDDIDKTLENIGADIDQTVTKVKSLGQQEVTFRIDTSQLDAVEKKLGNVITDVKQVDEQTVDITVKSDDLDTAADRLSGTKGKVEDLGKSASSSKSVLANMIGNSVQDIGSLGGVAGSAGVAIGQMGEYMADAAGEGEALGSVIASFSRVALPILALTVAVQLLSSAAEKVPKDIQGIVDSSGQGTDAVQGFADALNDSSRNLLDVSNDLEIFKVAFGLGEWNNARHAVEVFNDVLSKSPAAAANLLDQIIPLQTQLGLTADQVNKMSAAVGNSVQNNAAGQDAQKKYNQAVTDAHTLLEHGVAIRQKDGESFDDWSSRLRQAAAAYNLVDDAAAHAQDAQAQQSAALVANSQKNQKAAADLAKAVDDLKASWDEAGEASKSFGSVFGQQVTQNFAVHDSYSKVEDSLGNLVDTLKSGGAEFKATGDHLTTFTEDGRKALAATEALGNAIGTDLAVTLKNSGGDYDSVRNRAGEYRQALIDQATAAGASKDSIQGMIEMMGLTPEQVETTIKLSKDDEAKQKIAQLQGVIAELPETIKSEYVADIRQGDYQAAADLLTNLKYDPATGTWRDARITTTATGTAETQSDIHNVTTNDGQGYRAVVYVSANTGDLIKDITSLDGRYTIRVNLTTGQVTDSGGHSGHIMAGGPINTPGFYEVGEAGRETVFLPQGARVRSAGQTMTAQAGGGAQTVIQHIINLHVKVDPTVSLAVAGREIAGALDAFYRSSGSRPRAVA